MKNPFSPQETEAQELFSWQFCYRCRAELKHAFCIKEIVQPHGSYFIQQGKQKQKHEKARPLLLDELSVVEVKQDIFFQLMCDVHTGNICKKKS